MYRDYRKEETNMIEHEHVQRATFAAETKSVPAEAFEVTRQLYLAAKGIGHTMLFGIPDLFRAEDGILRKGNWHD